MLLTINEKQNQASETKEVKFKLFQYINKWKKSDEIVVLLVKIINVDIVKVKINICYDNNKNNYQN